jgi:quinol monooxygenase YgiN
MELGGINMMRFYLLFFLIVAETTGFHGLARASAPVGPIVVVSYIDILPDVVISQAEERAVALFKEETKATLKDSGIVSYIILRQIDGANHFTVVETWSDSSSYATHLGSKHTKEFRTAIQSYLGSPFDIRIHQVLP